MDRGGVLHLLWFVKHYCHSCSSSELSMMVSFMKQGPVVDPEGAQQARTPPPLNFARLFFFLNLILYHNA